MPPQPVTPPPRASRYPREGILPGPPADPGRRAQRWRAPGGAWHVPSSLLAYFSMTASTSRAESTRYSSPAYFTSVPPYLL